MIKKILVLASMALALVAVAAPAAQAETEWYVNGETLQGEITFEATGQITSDRGAFQTGPAEVHIAGHLFNKNGMASGTITEVKITGVVPTNLPGCTAQGTVANPVDWPLTLTTPDIVDIGDATTTVTFANDYSAGCAAFGVPPFVPVEGIVTGTYINDPVNNEVCIELGTEAEPIADDMHVEGTKQAPPTVDLTTPNGPICIEGVEAK